MANEMYSSRILSHGEITDLSGGFSLGGVPFSLFLRPKGQDAATAVVAPCRLICDDETRPFPFTVGDWTPGAVVSVPPHAIDTDVYEVYWGAGEPIKKAKPWD